MAMVFISLQDVAGGGVKVEIQSRPAYPQNVDAINSPAQLLALTGFAAIQEKIPKMDREDVSKKVGDEQANPANVSGKASIVPKSRRNDLLLSNLQLRLAARVVEAYGYIE